MDNINTCEGYVLNELATLKKENADLLNSISEKDRAVSELQEDLDKTNRHLSDVQAVLNLICSLVVLNDAPDYGPNSALLAPYRLIDKVQNADAYRVLESLVGISTKDDLPQAPEEEVVEQEDSAIGISVAPDDADAAEAAPKKRGRPSKKASGN